MAKALKEAFEGTAVVLTPDLPLRPKEALTEIRSIIDREQPDLLLGNSCGSLWRLSLLGKTGRYVLRESYEGRQNFQSFHRGRQAII